MKTLQTLKITAILLVMVVGFLACEKQVSNSNEESTWILGKWKLDDITTVPEDGIPLTLDYSPYSIIYNFLENNTVIISGEFDQIEEYKGHHIAGVYTYEIHYNFNTEPNPLGLPWPHRVTIGTITYSYSPLGYMNAMQLGGNDGYMFSRIN